MKPSAICSARQQTVPRYVQTESENLIISDSNCDDSDADDVTRSTIMNFKNPISKISKEIYIQSEMYK